jgi:hypothetical protein
MMPDELNMLLTLGGLFAGAAVGTLVVRWIFVKITEAIKW